MKGSIQVWRACHRRNGYDRLAEAKMLKLHPKILKRDGKKLFAILPYEEFLAVQEFLEDMEDMRLIEEARANDSGEPGIPLEEVKRRLGLK